MSVNYCVSAVREEGKILWNRLHGNISVDECNFIHFKNKSEPDTRQ